MCINMFKHCNGCGLDKQIELFSKNQSKCKECKKILDKNFNNNNPDYIINYRLKNKIRKQLLDSNFKKNNPNYYNEWLEKNPNYNSNYQNQNRDKINQNHKNWDDKNPHIVKWRGLLSRTLNNIKYNTTENLLGYSPQQLKEHLENQNINWKTDNVDHKIPITWFNPETPPHIVNDLRNLQPLSENKNKSKRNFYSDKIDKDYYDVVFKHIKKEFQNKLEF